MSLSKNVALSLVLLTHLFVLSGCSVVMALKQPDKKDLRVLARGVSRENVMTYLGAPINTEKTATGKIEMYQFIQGYSGGTKASRATFHGIADLFTLFIWELIAMPTEAILDGQKTTVKVEFDSEDKLVNFTFLEK